MATANSIKKAASIIDVSFFKYRASYSFFFDLQRYIFKACDIELASLGLKVLRFI